MPVDDITTDYMRDLMSRYQGAQSDPSLSYDDPTASPDPMFAPPKPNLSSRYYDPAGNFRFMAPNPQAPANQQDPQFMQGLQPIQNLAQLKQIMDQLKGAPDELTSKVLSKVTGIPIDSAKTQALRNSLLQIEARRQDQLPQQQFNRQMQAQNLELRKQQLADTKTYRQSLVDQGTKFSTMMLRQHIMDLRDQLKNMLPTDPAFKDTVQEYQESIKDFGNMAKGFTQSPSSATRGGAASGISQSQARPTSGTLNIGGKQVQWTRSPSEE